MSVHTGPNGETLYQPTYGKSLTMQALDDMKELQRRQRAWIDAGCPKPPRIRWWQFWRLL